MINLVKLFFDFWTVKMSRFSKISETWFLPRNQHFSSGSKVKRKSHGLTRFRSDGNFCLQSLLFVLSPFRSSLLLGTPHRLRWTFFFFFYSSSFSHWSCDEQLTAFPLFALELLLLYVSRASATPACARGFLSNDRLLRAVLLAARKKKSFFFILSYFLSLSFFLSFSSSPLAVT